MNWKIEKYEKYVLVYCNLNNKNYRRNNIDRFNKLINLINQNKDKKIILKCKTIINSNKYLYLLTDTERHTLSFKMLTSVEECLKNYPDTEEECIWIYIHLKPYYSVLHWLNSKNCNLLNKKEKGGEFLMKFVDNFNKHFNIPYCLTSDEAKIDCYGVSIDLSLSQIFKYGKTYYEKYGFEFDMNTYKNKDNMKLIKNKKHYLKTKIQIKDLLFSKLVKPLYNTEKKYFDNVIRHDSLSLGNVMKDIIQDNCEAYYDLLIDIKKHNNNLKNLLEIIVDAKTSYVKKYKYNKSKKKKYNHRKNTLKI
jgi:hypothetical protein